MTDDISVLKSGEYYNASVLCKEIGLSAANFNKLLEFKQYQTSSRDFSGKLIWTITDLGKQFGKELTYTFNNQINVYNQWNYDVLSKISDDDIEMFKSSQKTEDVAKNLITQNHQILSQILEQQIVTNTLLKQMLELFKRD